MFCLLQLECMMRIAIGHLNSGSNPLANIWGISSSISFKGWVHLGSKQAATSLTSYPSSNKHVLHTYYVPQTPQATQWMRSRPPERLAVCFTKGFYIYLSNKIESAQNSSQVANFWSCMRERAACHKEPERPGCEFWLFCSLTLRFK